MKQIVIEIDDEVYEGVTGDTTFRDDERKALNAIRNGTVLPDNPTNGKVIQALFPNIYEGFSNVIDLNFWWNAKYKAKEQEK